LKILITGAAGYVGQHLCLALAEKSISLRAFSRSAAPPYLQHVEWVQGSITNPQDLASAAQGCEKVIHLACLDLAASAAQPHQAIKTNGVGTLNVLEAALGAGAEQVIYTSTGQVYGGQSDLPNQETDLPHPDTPYAVSKLNGEHWCQWYAQARRLPVSILRLFNVYGQSPGGPPVPQRSTVDAIFLRRLAAGQPLQINGSPRSGRDFVNIDDVVAAILLSLDVATGPQPVNIGTGSLTTLEELAQIAAQVLGLAPPKPDIIGSDQPPVRFQADTGRAREALGFEAKIKLFDGLKTIKRRMHEP
jgi:UDP-glucose 4-epimerase